MTMHHPMLKKVFYKFRSLENWRFTIDIIVNSRLYAASFQTLNDPMEGRYYYFGDNVTKGFQKALLQSKKRRYICSLSQDKFSTLLWSYYAGGHTGIAFAVQVPDGSDIEIRDVRYDSGIYIGPETMGKHPDEVALEILTQKQMPWQHEREVRVFTATNFVPVKLTELVLGCNISKLDEELITTVARRWHPRITVSKLERSSLDMPEAV